MRLLHVRLVAMGILLVGLQAPAAAHASHHRSHQYVVVLDPGHGGDDTGAADSSQTLVEKNLTLQVAQRAEHDLQAKGYRVYLTRNSDRDVNVPARDINHDGKIDHVDELVARNVYANQHHADVFVSVHFDASASPDTHGTHGYYCPNRPFWHSSLRLSQLLTRSVAHAISQAGYPSSDNGVGTDVADVVPQTRADYPWFLVLGPSMKRYVIGTAMPGALIETLYLSSPRDVAAIRHHGMIDALGHGYAAGIEAYFHGRSRH